MSNTINRSSLLRQRIILMSGRVTKEYGTQIVAEMLFFNRENPQAVIQLYIKPISGPIYLLKAIQDTMTQIDAPVSTIAFDYTNSFSTAILTEGEKGMRYALPSTEIELYQLQELPEILKEDLIATYMRCTDKDYDTVAHDLNDHLALNPQQAIDYGLIDGIFPQNMTASLP